MSASVVFLRHGEIRPPRPGAFVGRLDLPLTPRGREQAQAWQPVLAELPLALAVTSPLSRTRETAAIALAQSAMEAEIWPELAEIDLGAWQGLTREEVETNFPGAFAARGQDLGHYRPEGGESFADLCRRVAPVLARLADLARQAGRPVLAVAHAGVIRAAACTVLGLGPERLLDLGLDYACASVIGVGASGLTLAALNLPPGTKLGGLV